MAESDGFGLYPVPGQNQQYIGGFEVGTHACFDNIDMTGVKSISVAYARDANVVSTTGRFAVLWGGSNLEVDTILTEKVTLNTSGWENFQDLKVGLEKTVDGIGLLCFYGLAGNGILNLRDFTLLAETGESDGITFVSEPVPNGPAVDKITVENGQVKFGGETKSYAGVSMFWSSGKFSADIFYTKEMVAWLKEEWDTKLIRAALAVDDDKPNGKPLNELGGYITNPYVNKLKVETVVNAAIENGMYVIIDWHAHKAEDYKEEAISFFQEMANKYGGYDNVIYEVYNEPVFTDWNQIKSYAEDVIAAIRAIDPDNLIIVGTRFYSQEVDVAAQSPITNYDNIAYTLHFYAATHKQNLRSKAQTALDRGIALFVTEWGTIEASGNGNVDCNSVDEWMSFLHDNNISHVNWAVSDLNQGSAMVKKGGSIFGGWPDQDLTDSGKKVKAILQNWGPNYNLKTCDVR